MATEFRWYGDEAIAKIKNGTAEGLNQAAEYLLGESLPLVPVETGNLRESGSVAHASASDLNSAVSYNARPYDVIQHERTDFRHPHGGQAKYLESPFTDGRETMLQIIRAAAGGAL